MEYRDQIGNSVRLDAYPRRIISLVPSQTEFLWDLGVRKELVGITKFCVHPAGLKENKALVGGTKKLSLETIDLLEPDLLIGNKEENDREQVDLLRQKYPVWMSDICTFQEAFSMMTTLGEMTNRHSAAASLVQKISESVDSVRSAFSGERVAYFIWNRPYMFAGARTFIDHVLSHIGLVNVAASLDRYPVLDIDDLRNTEPRFCFLSSEPYPFRKAHAEILSKLLPSAKVILVDGEIFSWYGSRLLNLPGYVEKLKRMMYAL